MKVFRLFVAFTLVSFALSPRAQAVSPRPDGCYPNFTTAEGCDALNSVTTGSGNTAIGYRSLFLDSSAGFNTGVGVGALALNNGDSNTAVGAAALLLNGSGTRNVAVGADALFSNNGGDFNTAVGAFAQYGNSDGTGNTALGDAALGVNTSGSYNTAIGESALNNDNGNDMGIGNNNTAVGAFALFSNESGSSNTALGNGALNFCTTGSFNVAIGEYAGTANVPSTGSFNVAIGDLAGTAVVTGSNIICIGAGVSGEDVSDTTWIANVYGVTTQSGTTAPVIVSDTGQLGTLVSSERFKKDIATMENASEAILSLRPVTFHYKTDTKGIPQFGLIAEEVAKVNPALVLPDKEGKPYTVRYEAVNAMLLNEFLKAHRKVEEQESKIEQQEAKIAHQQKQINALTAVVQKVSAQLATASPSRGGLEMNKSAPQVAKNN
jgi:trimeric autotransporter adhesin